MNKKAIENAVFVIILAFSLIAMGLTFWNFQIPMSSPTANVVAQIQPQAPCQIDCDDGEASVNPGAQEVCDDLIDNNCDGEIDEGCCGNGVQDPGEQCDPPGSRCKQGGNEGICTAADTAQPCSCNTALCQHCGDGICSFDENAQSCNQDCDPVCGNLACEAGEGTENPDTECLEVDDCQADCGNGACEGGQHICQDGDCDCPGSQTECTETASTCLADCGSGSICAGNALCQFSRNVYDPGDEGGFINCGVDCCSAACEDDSDCTPNQNFPCIAGTCITETGFCNFEQEEGCCQENSDCDDQNECTDDACDSNECTNTPTTDPCAGDSDPCTDDVCSGGSCVITPINCDDQDECTTDSCDGGTCVNLQLCCETNDDCDDSDLCTNDVCNQGTCAYTPQICNDEDLCTTDSCDDGECFFVDVDCSDENPCTVDACQPLLNPESFIPQNGDFECTHVFSAQLCPPPKKGGGGGGVTRTQESCCAPCYNDPNEQCEGRVGLSDGDCHQTTSKRCGQLEGETIPFELPAQAAEEETEKELPDVSGLPAPPEQPGQSEMQQSSAIGQSAADELRQRRSRTPIEGALAQGEKPTTPAAIAILFLIGLFIGVYAYLNREQIGAYFKKEEKKMEPAVKEIQHEWKQITQPRKKRGRKK